MVNVLNVEIQIEDMDHLFRGSTKAKETWTIWEVFFFILVSFRAD